MQTNTTSTTKTLGFIKDNDIWYADLPQFLEHGLGTRENLMMVDGADTFLDILSNHSKQVTLRIAPEAFKGYQTSMKKFRKGLNKPLLDLVGHAPVDYGAYYQVHEMHNQPYDHQLWLCPVTEYVFGNYPDTIYAAVV